MNPYSPNEIKKLKQSALDHLWVYNRVDYHRGIDEQECWNEPHIFVGGDGCRVTDIEGRTYLDAMSGLWLKNIGYGRKEITDAAVQQMRELTFMPMGTTTVPTIKLAEKLAQITPGDLDRCFFTSGGSESNETALKLARAYHKRNGEGGRFRFISRKGSYHGATFGAMSVSGRPSFASPADYEPLLDGILHAPHPNPYRCEYGSKSPTECAVRCAKAIEDLIILYQPETVAAVIAEPIASPPGCAVPGPEYWPMLRDICDRYGVLLIADEVITGFGRTGRMFACEHWGITPDIMTVAKGITSGYLPLGAAIAKKKIADAFIGSENDTFRHIITFGGHPVSAAVSLKNIEIIENEGLVENSAAMGAYLLDGLFNLKKQHSIIGDVRGMGLMCGMELVKDRITKETFPQEANLGNRLVKQFSDSGLLLKAGNAMTIAPPLCVTRNDIDEITAVMDRAFFVVEREIL